MKRLAILAIALAPIAAPAQEPAAMPGWMAGCWEMRADGQWAEECWTIPRAGQMMGSGRSGTATAITSFEVMRIEREDGAITFRAQPGGGAGWTVFSAAADPGEGVTFVNTEHDYPQRVRYWREGEVLNAEISAADGSEARRWSFKAMGGG
jgi:hypothetical protein